MSSFDALSSFSCGPSSSRGVGGSAHFPQPWLDYTSTAVPKTFTELIDWSEFVYLSSVEVREIYRRLFNYFITDLKIQSVSTNAKPLDESDIDNTRRLLVKQLGWKLHASAMCDNVAVYGNDFMSLVAPSRRFLECHHCTRLLDLERLVDIPGSDFKYLKGKFLARCTSAMCRRNGHTEVQDMRVHYLRTRRPEQFTIKHWPVREMVVYHYTWTDETEIFWRIPEDYKRAIAFGDPHTLATADPAVLSAIDSNTLFKFKEDRIFHAKEPTLSGIRTRGWGLPRTLYLSRQAWTLQLIRKQWQALGIDFVIPTRLVSPANTTMSGQNGISINPNTSIKHEDFARMISRVRAAHRRDPTQMHSIPVPVEYQILGGEASQLFPVELHNTAKEDLLEAGGFPVELYKGTLSMQAAPVGLRLFEAQNQAIPAMLNQAVDFISQRLAELGSRDPVDVEHQRVTLVDNLENWMAHLQLATGGQLSMQGALDRMGINYMSDLEQKMQEQERITRLQQEFDERIQKEQQGMQDMQQSMQPQDPNAAAGQPAAGGGDVPVDPYAGQLPSTGSIPPQDPEALEGWATTLAQTLVSMQDNMMRQRELKILREQHPTAHAIVTQRMKQFRQEAGAQGQQMILQGGAPGAPQA